VNTTPNWVGAEPDPQAEQHLSKLYALSATIVEAETRAAMRVREAAIVAAIAADRLNRKRASGNGMRGKNVNSRMLVKIQSDVNTIEWFARKWADFLNCSASAVSQSKAWETVMRFREDKRSRALEAGSIDSSNCRPLGKRVRSSKRS
jgi:hypothetical protein